MAPPPVTRTTLPLPLPGGPPPLPPPVAAPQAIVYCVPPRAMSVFAWRRREGLPAQAGQDGAGASAAWVAGRSAFSLANATFTVMVRWRSRTGLVGRAPPGIRDRAVSDAHRRPEERSKAAWIGRGAEIELIAAIRTGEE